MNIWAVDSLLETDLYKFSMMQIGLHRFSRELVEVEFKCRNGDIFTEAQYERICKEVDHLCTLRLQKEELDYLRTIRFLTQDFVDFLRLFQLSRDHITIAFDNGRISIKAKGSWLLVQLFEIYILKIVNTVYFADKNIYIVSGMKLLGDKIALVKQNPGFKFTDFGTRRAYNSVWHEYVVDRLVKEIPQQFVGTSNVFLAMKYNLTAIGTMAHEFIMLGQGIDVTLRNSQKHMLQSWVDEYRGDLGIALTDTVGMDAFLRDFDLYFAKLYDGLRHDSGDPYIWGEKAIEHYLKLKIDPKTKTLCYSDGLTFPKAIDIWNRFKDRANVSFGIGTNLTNDFEGSTPLNIVMKLTSVNGKPVAKLSDSPGKGMCHDDGYLTYLKSVFEVK